MITLRYAGAGVRADRYLQQQLPNLTSGALHKYHRQNKIKLNGKKQPLSTRLQAGDELRLYLPKGAAAPSPLVVLYEDEGLLAAYKPAGLISQLEDSEGLKGAQGDATAAGGLNGDEGVGAPDSLLARAATYLGPGAAPRLCHRLDTGTSGVLLVAKTVAVHDMVGELLRKQRLKKTYYGLCYGHPRPAAGTLGGWLAKNAATGTVRVLPANAPGARRAETDYRTISTEGPLALLELRPHTGRTHQLRAQLAAAGTPLLGDSRYGTMAANRAYRCRWQCLCATELRFPAGLPAPFAGYSGLVIRCQPPWFYVKMPVRYGEAP